MWHPQRPNFLKRFSLSAFTKRLLSAKEIRWRQIERFDPVWRSRIQRMASFLDDSDRSVVDVGCGPMWLREYLPADIHYTGIDYVYRGEGMIICDLNRDEIPAVIADVWFVSGCFEYVDDCDRFVSAISAYSRKCILSYCDTQRFPSKRQRTKRGWRNHLRSQQLTKLFSAHGMRQQHFEVLSSSNSLFVFTK